MSNQVRRIFSEKKKEFAVEAAGLIQLDDTGINLLTIPNALSSPASGRFHSRL